MERPHAVREVPRPAGEHRRRILGGVASPRDWRLADDPEPPEQVQAGDDGRPDHRDELS